MGCSDGPGRRSAVAADIFRPIGAGPYPVLLSHGPYAKGVSFQNGYAATWNRLAADYPEVTRNTTNKYQNFEVLDHERWVPHGYGCIRVDSRGAGRSPEYLNPLSARETQDLAKEHMNDYLIQ
jgi:uncharacterized protein